MSFWIYANRRAPKSPNQGRPRTWNRRPGRRDCTGKQYRERCCRRKEDCSVKLSVGASTAKSQTAECKTEKRQRRGLGHGLDCVSAGNERHEYGLRTAIGRAVSKLNTGAD